MNNCGLKAYLDGKNAITIVTDTESSFTINGNFLCCIKNNNFNDETNEILTDYDIEINNGVQDAGAKQLFTVSTVVSENGIHRFSLTPSDDEGVGTLYIKTTCSDESGKVIRATVNVNVQARIDL